MERKCSACRVETDVIPVAFAFVSMTFFVCTLCHGAWRIEAMALGVVAEQQRAGVRGVYPLAADEEVCGMSGKMTDEQVKERLGWIRENDFPETADAFAAHIAVVTAERDEARASSDDYRHGCEELTRERDALRERVAVLKGKVEAARLGSRIARRERDESRTALENVMASLAAIRQWVEGFAGVVSAAAEHARGPRGGQQVPFHGDFGNIPPSSLARLEWYVRAAREIVGNDAAREHLPCSAHPGNVCDPETPGVFECRVDGPLKPLHCCGTTTEIHRASCPTVRALKPLGMAPPSEMDGLRGEMAERPCGNCAGVQPETCAAHAAAPTTAEAFAKLRGFLREDYDPEEFEALSAALSLLERRMVAMARAARNLLYAHDADVHLTRSHWDALRGALTDAPPVFTLEEVRKVAEDVRAAEMKDGTGTIDPLVELVARLALWRTP